MPFFIMQSERKTWTKFIVEAKEEKAAFENCDEWEYLGYVDGEDTVSDVVGGPFDTRDEVFEDETSYVDYSDVAVSS